MMTRTPSQKRMLLKYLSVLPFILIVSLVFTNQKVQAEISKVEEMEFTDIFHVSTLDIKNNSFPKPQTESSNTTLNTQLGKSKISEIISNNNALLPITNLNKTTNSSLPLENITINYCPWAGKTLPISKSYEITDFKILDSSKKVIYGPANLNNKWDGTLNNHDQIQSGIYEYEYNRIGNTYRGKINITYIVDGNIHLWPDENAILTYNEKLSQKYFKYPEDALIEKAEGGIILDLIVENDGAISKVNTDDEFYTYHPSLAKAAVDYITNAYIKTGNQITPALKNNKPVRSKLTIVVPFSLEHYYKKHNIRGPIPKGINTTIERKNKTTYPHQIKTEKKDNAPNLKKGNLRNFKIEITQIGKEILFKCLEGCNWLDVAGTHLGTKILVNSVGINVTAELPEDDDMLQGEFAFKAELINGHLYLQGINGMTWEKLSFDLPSNSTKVINQNGMVTSTDKINFSSTIPTVFDRSKTKYFIIERDNPFKLSVFNRWGNQVYHSENYQNDWAGTWNRKPLPDETYFFMIEEEGKKVESEWVKIEGGSYSYNTEEGKVYEFVDQMPEYKEGIWALSKAIQNTYEIPANIPKGLDNYICVVSAVVNEEGALTDIRCTNDIGYGTKAISERAVNEISQSNRWIPGKLNGENVKVRISLEVPFKIYKPVGPTAFIVNEDGYFLYQGVVDRLSIPKKLILTEETTPTVAGKTKFETPTIKLKNINTILPVEVQSKKREIIYGISKYFRAEIINNQLNLSFKKIKKPTNVLITDISGKTHYHQSLNKMKGKRDLHISKSVTHFPKGMLVLSLIQGDQVGHTLLFNY